MLENNYLSSVHIMRTKIIGRGKSFNVKAVWTLYKYKLKI